MKQFHKINKLAKFILYVLGRQPDEFGLYPNADGYVKIKDLLKVMAEEEGWRHVRKGHLTEIVLSHPSPPLQIEGNCIRACDRSQLITPTIPLQQPKLLYHPVRQRAYGHVAEKGVLTAELETPILLHRQHEMAERMGKRIDAAAVILTVNCDRLTARGNRLLQYGSDLFVTDGLPVGSFSGPPLPEKKETAKSTEKQPPAAAKTPGSFYLDLNPETPDKKPVTRKDRKNKNAWKRERRRKSRMR